jgi:hypothetical protein
MSEHVTKAWLKLLIKSLFMKKNKKLWLNNGNFHLDM